MPLFVSVVNHNHDKIICSNPTLKHLSSKHYVIIKSNSSASLELIDYCNNNKIKLIQGHKKKGFAENNNEVFSYAKDNLKMQPRDYFLVLNPDVEISLNTVDNLLAQVTSDDTDIAAINLYRDKEMLVYDNSIRSFPSLMNPVKTLFGVHRTDYYDKDKIAKPMVIDWAAGSFLLFKSSIYRELEGFDERYFMYYEDVDICSRAKSNNIKTIYYPNHKGVHLSQSDNRRFFSRQFFYYLQSMAYYFIKKK